MTTTKDIKRLILARKAKTGESYSIARMHVLQALAKGTPPAGTPSGSPEAAAPSRPLWTSEWAFEGKDIAHEMLAALYDDIVDCVHSGEYPVGYTEIESLIFKNIDLEAGTAEFHVDFTAEHPSEGFDFNGHVAGDLAFDTDFDDEDELDDAERKGAFLDSLRVAQAEAHFDMGDPD
jgi:hypothetical protein